MSAEGIVQATQADRAMLGTAYRVRSHVPLGDETPLSREVYRRILRYVRRTQSRLRPWPLAEGCLCYKEDGHFEWAVRRNASIALSYSTLLAGDYDEGIAGTPRERIARDFASLMRYIAITHRANLLPTGDGQPWGDHWQSAFWAATAGQAAWLGWDRLDDATRAMVARMVIHEANRFNTRPPDSGYRLDTKAEENAWNSDVIVLAACMFPEHPNARLWRERAIVYMINSFTREADKESSRVVDGRPARERITAVTLHPDFVLENHNRVHPDYLSCPCLILRNAVLYRAAGLDVPQSASFNAAETFAWFKRFAAVDGSLFYLNAQDWWPHRYDASMLIAPYASVLLMDPDAAFLERATLTSLGRMHARFEDGSAWDAREYNYPGAEEELLAQYCQTYLLHRSFGDGPRPSTREEFLRRQSGVRVSEDGRFVIHRTPEKFVSFVWGDGVMGLVYPRDDTWFTSPYERGFVGEIVCQGQAETPPQATAHRVRTLADGGFSLAVRVDRCGGKVGQDVAVFSSADGPVVYVERLVAREDITVTEIATGSFGILNEDAKGISPNRRTVHHAAGKEEIAGRGDGAARLLEWKTPWANVDGRFGVVSTSGTMAYRDNNAYQRARLEEVLIANHRTGIGEVRRGTVFSACAVACVPNQSPEATAASRIEFVARDDGVLAARFKGVVAVANLGREPVRGRVFDSDMSLGPLETTMVPDSR